MVVESEGESTWYALVVAAPGGQVKRTSIRRRVAGRLVTEHRAADRSQDDDATPDEALDADAVPRLLRAGAATGRLTEAVRTGRLHAIAAVGLETLDYLRQHPDEASELSRGTGSLSLPLAQPGGAAESDGWCVVVDVAGVGDDRGAERQPRRAPSDHADLLPHSATRGLPPGDTYLLELASGDDDALGRVLPALRPLTGLPTRLVAIQVLREAPDVVPLGPDPGSSAGMTMLFRLGGPELSLDVFDALVERAGYQRAELTRLAERYVCVELESRG